MGNSDDDSDFAEYGTALDPIEEDDAARKRPIAVSDQIAVDERGRRRFHGAFTGGFSAGYFNSVGSKEGWTPSTFKSSRSDRNNLKSQNVLDFMDDEDKGAFGIAPQVLRPTDDFTDKSQTKGRKRAWSKQAEGTIPGAPVLDQLIQPVKETAGIKILIKMGWRPGKGVGPKVQRKAKKARLSSPQTDQTNSGIERPMIFEDDAEALSGPGNKVYGCSIPAEFLKRKDREEDSSEEELEVDELLAPDDVSALLCNPKENTFGLGYKGLDRNTLTPAGGQVDLFGTKLKFRVDNKKMSITGEAFGVGAFEENDDDIYSREDMSQYDFALETPEERKRRKVKEDQDKRKAKTKENCIEGFRISNNTKTQRKSYPPPTLPPNFQPYHMSKKSRFDVKKTQPSTTDQEDYTAKGLGRHSLKISERQVLIEDDINKIVPLTPAKKEAEKVETSSELAVAPTQTTTPPTSKPRTDEDTRKRIEKLMKFTQVLQAYNSKKPEEPTDKVGFKPFMKNPDKQERYDKYLTLVQAGFAECLRDLQPVEMTEWEREREKTEFERASKLYKPMNSILANRFTSAKSHDISHLQPEKEIIAENDPKDDPKVAARKNMFGKYTHRVFEWHPDKLLCKRFNIPNPYPDSQFVGVKGDPDVFARTAKPSNLEPNTTTSIPALPVPKKSLFDNLDFSKPPPGLLPPGTEAEHVHDPSESTSSGPVLEFQKELTGEPSSSSASTTRNIDEEEEKFAKDTRPPIDLFKEIFADSSSSDSEEEEDAVSASTSEGIRGNLLKDKDILQNKAEAGSTPNLEQKPIINKEDNTVQKQQRRVFDQINLDELRPKTQHKLDKHEEEDEEMEDTYGPLPPSASTIKTALVSASSSGLNSKGNFSKAMPNSSSTPILFNRQPKAPVATPTLPPSEDVVWVEKSAVKDSIKKNKHSSKKSKKKSGKKDKRKSHKKEKKRKKKSRKHKKGKTSDTSSTSGSDSDDDSGASSDSSIILNDSLNIRALQAKLKQMTK